MKVQLSCLIITAAAILAAQPKPKDAISFVQHNWPLTEEELQALKSGYPIGKRLKTAHEGEVGILGAIRLNRSKDEFVEWYRNVENFKHSQMVTAVGVIGSPPQRADLAKLSLEPNEVRAIVRCKPGACGLKLTPKEIERFQSEVDLSSSNVNERTSALARQMILEYLTDYWKRGNAALGVYEDKKDRINLDAVFRELLESSPWLKESFPEQYEQLRSFAGASNGTADEFMYWSRESYGFGLKPILNLFHVGIRKVNPKVTLISSKQIRSTHYFDGSLGLIVLFDADAAGKQCYMIYINRSRVDLLRGWGWKRALFERRLPGEIRKQLVLIQQSVEESKGGHTAHPTLPSS